MVIPMPISVLKWSIISKSRWQPKEFAASYGSLASICVRAIAIAARVCLPGLSGNGALEARAAETEFLVATAAETISERLLPPPRDRQYSR